MNSKPIAFYGTSLLILAFLAACSPTVNEDDVSPAPTNTPGSTRVEEADTTPELQTLVSKDSPSDLDAVWEEMPVPSTPVPPTPMAAAPDSGNPARYFPDSEPEGRIYPTPDAVWMAGHLNGRPTGVEAPYPAGEYASERDFSNVVHLRDPNELPAFLETGQTLVIHLPPLPPDLYLFYAATTGGTEEEEKGRGSYKQDSHNRRFLRIRFNDHIVWQRTTPPFHAITRVALNPNRLNPAGNLITLENLGTQPLPIDALWLEPHRPKDRPMFVALDNAQWLNRNHAGWVRTTRLRFDAIKTREYPWAVLPNGDIIDEMYYKSLKQVEHLPPEPGLPSGIREPVTDAGGLPVAWNNLQKAFKDLETMDHPHLEELATWVSPVRKASERGILPIVHMWTDALYPWAVEAPAYLFGDIAAAWIFPGWTQMMGKFNKDGYFIRLRNRIKDPVVYAEAEGDGWGSLTERPFWQGFHLSLLHGRHRAELFQNGVNLRHFPRRSMDALVLDLPYRQAYKPEYHASDSRWIFNSAAEWLMRHDAAVIVKHGQPGGPFFPDGSDRPSDLWNFLRPMFRFGSPDHHPGVANLVASGPADNPVFLHWGVADNGKNSVQVLAHTSFGPGGGEAVLELPVPWEGATRMVHHSTQGSIKLNASLLQKSIHADLEAVPMSTGGENGAKGWIRHSFQMMGMHVFEFYPEGYVDHRKITAPENIGFSELAESSDLFNVQTDPPPSWWSRKDISIGDFSRSYSTETVALEHEIPATRDGAPGWELLKGVHAQQPKDFTGVSPLSATSSRIRFNPTAQNEPCVARIYFGNGYTQQSEALGLWIRAHRPPGFVREFDAFHANPIARFYLGKPSHRQLIEVEYDRWHFISTSSRIWEKRTWGRINPDPPPVLLFWPAEGEAFQPVLEVNSFATYRLSLEEGVDTPEKALGFVREREDGSMAFLLVGLPDQPAFWSQRLDTYLDPASIRHVEDAPRVVSAESPDDPPPEEVRHDLEWIEESRLLEVHIPRMPPPPTNWYRQRILKDFPLIGWVLKNADLSAVLFNEVRESGKGTP